MNPASHCLKILLLPLVFAGVAFPVYADNNQPALNAQNAQPIAHVSKPPRKPVVKVPKKKLPKPKPQKVSPPKLLPPKSPAGKSIPLTIVLYNPGILASNVDTPPGNQKIYDCPVPAGYNPGYNWNATTEVGSSGNCGTGMPPSGAVNVSCITNDAKTGTCPAFCSTKTNIFKGTLVSVTMQGTITCTNVTWDSNWPGPAPTVGQQYTVPYSAVVTCSCPTS